jgi:hypothetical protein
MDNYGTWALKQRRTMPRHLRWPAGEGSAPPSSAPKTSSTSPSMSAGTAPSIVSDHRPTQIYRYRTPRSSPESWTRAGYGHHWSPESQTPASGKSPRRNNWNWKSRRRICAEERSEAAPRRRRRSRRRLEYFLRVRRGSVLTRYPRPNDAAEGWAPFPCAFARSRPCFPAPEAGSRHPEIRIHSDRKKKIWRGFI